MAVSETGRYLGSFSGGCVEAAVVGEARRVIASGKAELVRFGDGSPYIDIELPCGGGIDLLIMPAPATDILLRACEELTARRPVVLQLGLNGTLAIKSDVNDQDRTGWNDGVFQLRHNPDLRLVVVGHGEESRSLAALASSYGAIVSVLSPDIELVSAMQALGVEANVLKTPGRSPWLRTDRYSAVVLLFHDHDWEGDLLEQVLEQDAFFVGAMGSRTTHALRVADLLNRGVGQASIDRITGPIGLIPATRDPATLALSALSQIAMAYDKLS